MLLDRHLRPPLQSQPFGLTPVDLNTIYVTFGAGRVLTYAETGMMVSATFGHRVSERTFRPKFARSCLRGFVSFQSWDVLWKHRLARDVVSLPKAVDAIREVQIAFGGDYHYFKYFDPYENYEKNPHKLDRFMKGSLTEKGQQRNMTKRKLFAEQFAAHKKDPRKFRWF